MPLLRALESDDSSAWAYSISPRPEPARWIKLQVKERFRTLYRIAIAYLERKGCSLSVRCMNQSLRHISRVSVGHLLTSKSRQAFAEWHQSTLTSLPNDSKERERLTCT